MEHDEEITFNVEEFTFLSITNEITSMHRHRTVHRNRDRNYDERLSIHIFFMN